MPKTWEALWCCRPWGPSKPWDEFGYAPKASVSHRWWQPSYSREHLSQRKAEIVGSIPLDSSPWVFWAQTHGSFVLVPAIFLAHLADIVGSPRQETEDRSIVLLTLLGLLVGLASSAWGLDIVDCIATHAAGDARLFIRDMSPPPWETFNPGNHVYGPLFVALVLLGLAGMVRSGRIILSDTLLLVLGVLLALRAVRFLSEGSVLAMPAAYRGWVRLSERPSLPRLRMPIAASLGLLGLIAIPKYEASRRGPLGQVGLEDGRYPLVAVKALQETTLPPSTPLLTHFGAGAPLGFDLDGRFRTYVDSRTPLYFDETDFAVSRDVGSDGQALERARIRYGFKGAVLARDDASCRELRDRSWAVIAIEPSYTTFVDANPDFSFEALAPCGANFLREDACKDGGARLNTEIDHLERYGRSAFVRYLRAESVWRCGGDKRSVAALLPSEQESATFLRGRNLLSAHHLLEQGKASQAFALLMPLLSKSDQDAFRTLMPYLVQHRDQLSSLRTPLQELADTLRDSLPHDTRSLLAEACAMEGDAECVRFHGIRAVVRGSSFAAPLLQWLVAHHPMERVRRDAEAWLHVQNATVPRNSGTP